MKMWLHSVSDLITNSSTVVYIYPFDNAIETTKKLLSSLLPGTIVEDYKVYFEINEDWFQRVFDYEAKIADDFLETKNMTFDDYFSLDQDEADKLLTEFTAIVKQQWAAGTLDFKFEWDEYREKDWARWLDIIVEPPGGERFVLNQMLRDIFGLGYYGP